MSKSEMLKLFRLYIYGYLNVYYNSISLFDNDGKRYYEYQKNHVLNYLRLTGFKKKFFLFISPLLIKCEKAFSLLVVFVHFLIALIKYPFAKKQTITESSSLIYGLKGNVSKFNSLISGAKIDKSELIVVMSPFVNKSLYRGYVVEDVLSRLSLKEIIICFFYGLKMTSFLVSRYSKQDCFFRSYSSFEFFLVGTYFFKNNAINRVYYISLIERWAFLFGNLPNYTVFLQHGQVTFGLQGMSPKVVGHVDEGFFINQEQYELCCRMFSNKPIAHYLPSFQFTASEKILRNGKKNVLLICAYLYYEKEKEIIRFIIDNVDVNLYIKPHPTDDPKRYTVLGENSIILLEKDDYPPVDIVISYGSTLALEYKSNGVNVIMHTKEDWEKRLMQLL